MGTLYGMVVFPQFYLGAFIVSAIQYLVDVGISFIEYEFSENPVKYLRTYEIVRKGIYNRLKGI
jgi:hypothetical protein